MSNHSNNATVDLFLPETGLMYVLGLSFFAPLLLSLGLGLGVVDRAVVAGMLSGKGTGWVRVKNQFEAGLKVMLLYFLGPILLWQSTVLSEEVHYVTNPSTDQPDVCDAVLRGGYCFVVRFQNAGASFLKFGFPSSNPETFETHLDFLKATHTNMRLTCVADDDNGEMLNLPQEAYNTTTLPTAPGIPDNTTHIAWADYQLVINCYVLQPQTVTGWLNGVGVATAALGALVGFYSTLDSFCRIGEPEPISKAATTRKMLANVLRLAGIGIIVVFIFVALAFQLDALPNPTIAEMYTAMMTGFVFLYCGMYISKYSADVKDEDKDEDDGERKDDGSNNSNPDQRRVDPWANLEKLFEAHSDDKTKAGLWTPASTAALAGYREVHKNDGEQYGSLPSFSTLMELSGKELTDEVATRKRDADRKLRPELTASLEERGASPDEEEEEWKVHKLYIHQLALLVFIAAIKTIPVQAGPYASKKERAGHFTIEEIWDASWAACFFGAYRFGAYNAVAGEEAGGHTAETHFELEDSDASDDLNI